MTLKTLHLLFSHHLTDEQIKDAKDSMQVTNFTPLPSNLQKAFSNIPPELETLTEFAKPFKTYLQEKAKEGDFVLIQGDFGLCFILVEFCKQNNLIPVYATTKRIAVEENGIKISKFKHSRFRRYI
jgi:CRISPR/Cas system-associated protein Cas10 (large subunit of type III CRISPR-Cas system)